MERQKPLIGIVQYMVVPGLGGGLNSFDIEVLKSFDEEQITRLITTTVCMFTKESVEQLVKDDRHGLLPLSRQLSTYYMRIYAHMKLKQIARLLRPKKPFDHATISHNIETITHCLDLNQKYPFAKQVQDLDEQIISKLKQRINESDSTNW